MIGLYDAYAEMEYTAFGVLMIAISWPIYLYLTPSEKKGAKSKDAHVLKH